MARTGIATKILLFSLLLSFTSVAQTVRTSFTPIKSKWRGLHQGDFVDGSPLMKFGTLPVKGSIAASLLTLTFNYNDSTLISNPRVAGLGSSTLAGVQPVGSTSYPSVLQARFTANGYTLSFFNYSLGGQTSAPIRPMVNGGTAGVSVDDALNQSPGIILLDEPTNWAASYDTATQASYWKLIFRYAWARGVIVVVNGSRPRTNYNSDPTNSSRLTNFRRTIVLDDTLRAIANNDYRSFLQYGTVARMDTTIAYSDSVHMTAPGVVRLENDQWNFWRNKFFTKVTAFKTYVVYSSVDSSSWTYFDSTATGNTTVKSYTPPVAATWYRVFGRYKDNSVTPNSIVKITPVSVDSVAAQFNFNATAQGVTGWTDVSGDPHLTVITATDSRRSISVSSVATTKWKPNGNNAVNSGGATVGNPSFIFGSTVTASYWFNNGLNTTSTPYDFTYAANGYNILISGLTPGSSYKLEFLGSRLTAQVATADRQAGYWVTDASGTTNTTLNVKGNTANVATFTHQVADGSGRLFVGIYCPVGGNSTNTYQYGYINGLRVTIQSP
jgi:hypothetical protein